MSHIERYKFISEPLCTAMDVAEDGNYVWYEDHLSTLSARDAEIARLQSRLEISPEHSYDGIDCRDVTIRELEGALAKVRAETLELAARTIELYDDKTMEGDYMLDAGECAGIIRALAAPCDQQKG